MDSVKSASRKAGAGNTEQLDLLEESKTPIKERRKYVQGRARACDVRMSMEYGEGGDLIYTFESLTGNGGRLAAVYGLARAEAWIHGFERGQGRERLS